MEKFKAFPSDAVHAALERELVHYAGALVLRVSDSSARIEASAGLTRMYEYV